MKIMKPDWQVLKQLALVIVLIALLTFGFCLTIKCL